MRLSDQEIGIEAPRGLCFEVVASAGRVLERRSETELVVEFTTDRDGTAVRTVELLVREKPTAIFYRWLEGPVPEVTEVIYFDEIGEARTRLRYKGRFSLRRDPIGAVIGRYKVKAIFDRLVREHLEEAKTVSERRAERSRVYPSVGPRRNP